MRQFAPTVWVLIISAVLGAAALAAAPSTQTPTVGDEDRIRGTTVRWTWTEGVVKGVTHEHMFGQDGTVVWRVLDGPQKGHEATEKEYSAVKVADDVYAVSYLAASGNTLTVVLNFRDMTMVGYASSAKNWYPMRGTFQIVK